MADIDQKPLSARDRFQEAYIDPDVPVIYLNGFGIRIGSPDVGVILLLDDFPVGIINGSHATMKTFSQSLIEAIEELEKSIGQKFLSSDEITEALQREQESEEANGNDEAEA